jgi:hypothetical protein
MHGKYGCTGKYECTGCTCLKGEQQQKTNDFWQRFISFERHLFAVHFLGP